MTRTNRLKEVCKFLSGLVAADMLVGLWFLATNSLPGSFFGIWVTVPYTWLWVAFDLFVLLVLIHYAWNPRLLEPRASSKPLLFVIGLIFAAVAIVHFLRLVFSWPVIIDGWSAPLWVSWIGVIVAGYISYTSFHFASKHGKLS